MCVYVYVRMYLFSEYQAARHNTGRNKMKPCAVGPCHHGMARPQVADSGMASDTEGSCE